MSDVFRKMTDKQRRATEFLQNLLSDGQTLSVETIVGKAESAGISRQSLAFARKLLKIRVTRNSQCGCFHWSLPE